MDQHSAMVKFQLSATVPNLCPQPKIVINDRLLDV